jgi:hypothetical protein
MQSPKSRDGLNALRAEPDAVWPASTFDQPAASRIYTEMVSKLNQSRPADYIGPHERKSAGPRFESLCAHHLKMFYLFYWSFCADART